MFTKLCEFLTALFVALLYVALVFGPTVLIVYVIAHFVFKYW